MTTTVERKYALTKIAAGDYLLPSNDASTLWRIRQYEDGPTHGLKDWLKDITLWRVEKWHEPIIGGSGYCDPDNPDEWNVYAECFDTRREAIEWAVSR